MNYFLLEDNKIHQRFIKNLVSNIQIFNKPQDLLKRVHTLKSNSANIFILDLELGNMPKAGILTANFIRQADPHAQIIIFTSHSDLTSLCFEYHLSVLDYIYKGDAQNKIQQRLLASLKKAQNNLQRLIEVQEIPIKLPNGSRFHKVDLNNILFIASEKGTHYLEIHGFKSLTKIRANLKDIPSIHNHLIQVHAAYCINSKHIQSYSAKDHHLTLKNGIRLPVSRPFNQIVRQLL
ncbi:LytR/AlgR family response regulator transcription factor [Convivina praedatoris]|uniref:Accessory gene regulator protein A n=1 Tax=Convivina praedatoris TaxID=2880963 RepID=A0ABN8HF98_9LACO|nr:response regulator transcription factor [Convivina sp. LMG 32447]CAH1855698.1 Accessory gene regulator protein A [Convivina sp. LMG 32447]CAH1856728.1 Accessory gene regulator protein A [Convivina sp. LMG 32447]CAH1856781.1 Accessory gene regulator protein A [Convivina sp. LMG 32447]